MKHLLMAAALTIALLATQVETSAQPVAQNTEQLRFRLDPVHSKFIVHADRTGIAWFRGKSHFIAAKNFSGEALLTTDLLHPASLVLTVKTVSLEETGAAFTDQQKGIIKKELDELVLESGKFPEITFRSTQVTGKPTGGSSFEVRIDGELTLHGVTKHVAIPARVSLSGDELHAVGEFSINRKNFGVNATEAFHGFVRVKHKLRFTFDIIGNRF